MDGYKETELAQQLGRTPSWVSERLSELRQEIQLQNGLLPPLTDPEYQALVDSIRVYGVRHAVLLGEHIPLVDGRHRLLACTELQIDCPAVWLEGLTQPEEEELAIALNATRRHLNRQQKRKLVEYELMRDSNRSDRRIASVCGVTGPTVAQIRQTLQEAAGQWNQQGLPRDLAPQKPSDSPADEDVQKTVVAERQHEPELHTGQNEPTATPPEHREDTLGRQQPARRERTRQRPGPTPRPPKPLAQLDCPYCHTHLELHRRNSRYTLEQ